MPAEELKRMTIIIIRMFNKIKEENKCLFENQRAERDKEGDASHQRGIIQRTVLKTCDMMEMKKKTN